MDRTSFSSYGTSRLASSVGPPFSLVIAAAAAQRRRNRTCCCGLQLSSGVQTISVSNIVFYGLCALSRLYEGKPDQIGFGVAGIFVNVVLLCGAKESRPRFLLFWLVIDALVIAVAAAGFVYLVVAIVLGKMEADVSDDKLLTTTTKPESLPVDCYPKEHQREMNISNTTQGPDMLLQAEILDYLLVSFFFVAIGVSSYFWYVVLSFYMEIVDAKKHGEFKGIQNEFWSRTQQGIL